MELINFKSSWTMKETRKVKRQSSEWQKMIVNEAIDKVKLKNIQAAHATQYQKK